MALRIMSRAFRWYPFVKYSIALAYRAGESSRPGRLGSSPMHSRMVFTAPQILSIRSAESSGSDVLPFVPGHWRLGSLSSQEYPGTNSPTKQDEVVGG